MTLIRWRRRVRKTRQRVRAARMLASAFKSRYRPVVAHLIPVRRCNLACAYCNEYDDHSAPVSSHQILQRIDRLAALGTGIITLSGGEPLLHPDAAAFVHRIRQKGAIATLITNGFLLSRDRIRQLNRAGLDHLQISIDNVVPDEVSKKSLKTLDQKLVWLGELAEFDVTVNSVVGAAIGTPEDALTIARRAQDLGFSATVGVLHDASGRLAPLDARQQAILAQISALGGSAFDYAHYNRFQRNLAEGRPNDWHCRAGSRYLYVCEDGLVHWCSQQRGQPAIPLEQYTAEDLRREYHREKPCAPLCTVGCVHRVAQIDELRENPQTTLARWFPATGSDPSPPVPVAVRALRWAFVTNPHRDWFRGAAVRLLGTGRNPD